MDSEKVAKFIALAGQKGGTTFRTGSPEERALGAQLLLSEVLEYVIDGLGVIPEIKGVKIEDADSLSYHAERTPDQLEMLDGLADVAYTMNWNAVTFGIPLEEAYELVCNNNLEKFVALDTWAADFKELPKNEWACRQGVIWPTEVQTVSVVNYKGQYYAVGKDSRGKVRKPSTYKTVDLSTLIAA